jgi:hypothetical protein
MDIPASREGKPPLQVICHLSPDQDLYGASGILTGLCELSAAGRLRMTLAPRAEGLSRLPGGGFCPLTLRSSETNAISRLVLDLSDHSDLFSGELLEWCDLYLKRSYYRRDVAKLRPAGGEKVRPFGLNYACRSRGLTVRALGAAARALWGAGSANGERKKPLAVRLRGIYQFWTTPLRPSFEHPPDARKRPMVVYQTRMWDPVHAGPDAEDLNRQRAELVRALRQTFRDRFAGGVVPTAFARAHFGDIVTTFPARFSSYIAFSREILIGVNTRGLYQSAPFKLPEYLASAKCVVGDSIRNELPQPLEPGVHYLQFGSVDECLTHCERLLSDADLANGLSRRAWEYYTRHVRPAEHPAFCLRQAWPAAFE